MFLQASHTTAAALVCDAVQFRRWKLFGEVYFRKIEKNFLQFLLNLRDIMNWSFGRARKKLVSAEDGEILIQCLSLSVTETLQKELLQSRNLVLGLTLQVL